jgi:nitronate monooxygenase
MLNATEMTRRLGIRWPIVQGPFGGGLSTVELTAAVSNAGGLGSFGAHALSADEIAATATAIRARTDAPFALNLWVPLQGDGTARVRPDEHAAGLRALRPYLAEMGLPEPPVGAVIGHDFRQQAQAVLDARPAAFSFVFGVPAPDILEECRRRGIVTLGTATNVDEALALDAAGVDLIVASGYEAGGHRAAFLRPVDEAPAASALVPQVVDAVRAPVIAAGGVADGRGIVAMLALGASGVQVGTAFLASAESGASPAHKQALLAPEARYTVLTRAFSGRPARGIVNRLVRELRAHEAQLPPYPLQNWLTLPLRRAAGAAGRAEFLALWAGQNAPLVKPRRAAEVMEFLLADTERARQALEHAFHSSQRPK